MVKEDFRLANGRRMSFGGAKSVRAKAKIIDRGRLHSGLALKAFPHVTFKRPTPLVGTLGLPRIPDHKPSYLLLESIRA